MRIDRRRFRAWTAAALVSAVGATVTANAATVRGRVKIEEASGGRSLDPSGAVVYLDNLPAGTDSPPPGRFTIETKSKRFIPQVLPVPVGSRVSFPNSDGILHNVFSASGANAFDLGLYGKHEAKDTVFSEPGLVRVYCNVHEKMVAFVLVCPSRYFARVRDDGSFEIADAPAGRYDVKVWDERGGMQSSSVEVGAGDTLDVGFTMDGSKYQRAPHLDKNGKPYSARASADYE
jgi:plastocyanin